MMRLDRIVLVFALAACGGGSKPAPTTPTTTATTGSGAGEAHHGDHPKLTPELDAFHAVLSARWHMDAGPARMKDTCASVPDFQSMAGAVKAASAPANVEAAAWTTATTNLETSVGGLATACGGTDQAAFDAALTKVHDAFHASMALIVGEHEHGDAMGGGHGAEHHGH